MTAIATSKSGARVSYTVTATDNVDPNPTVKCTPPSGSLFPLGQTPVNCTATDASGNKSTGTFIVKVIVAWGGFLPPVNQDGSSRFPLGLPIALRFALTGASANICDLTRSCSSRRWTRPENPAPSVRPPGRPPGDGKRLLLHPDHQPVRDAARHAHRSALGPWQLRVDLGDGEIHTQRITMVRLLLAARRRSDGSR